MERLQKFDFKSSPYHRPNQEWVCGRADSGEPCAAGASGKGKCGAGPQCQPMFDSSKQRWKCTRSQLQGGTCQKGPGPNGECCVVVLPCVPKRSWRSKRKLVTRSILAVTVGLLLVGLGGNWIGKLVNPGPMTYAHAAIDDCSMCHVAKHDAPTSWLASAFASGHEGSASQTCLTCHQVGEAPLMAHGLVEANLPEVSSQSNGAGPWQVEVGNALFGHSSSQGELECASCHNEHQGQDADLTAISDQQCQACHSTRFKSLKNGHPEFVNYPYERRTRINFDHAAHIGKHFPDNSDEAPETCATCHAPADDGSIMVVRDFAKTCSGCHQADVTGEKLSGAKGIAMIEVPGLDLETLEENGIDIGQWPEFAEAELTPLTQLLLGSDSEFASSNEHLADLDLLDLVDASSEQLSAVKDLAWSFKRMMNAIEKRGASELTGRLAPTMSATGDSGMSYEQKMKISALMSSELIIYVNQDWFPNLGGELSQMRKGKAPSTVAMRPKPKKAVEEPEEEEIDASELDDPFGGDIFGDDIFASSGDSDSEDESAGAESADSSGGNAVQAVKELSLDEKMQYGGWYKDDYALRFRPTGHADSFAKAWLSAVAPHPALEAQLDSKNPGSCTKCHAVSGEGADSKLDWQPRMVNVDDHPFTVFSHLKHFNILGDEGCQTCHVMNAEAKYAESFEQRDPTVFQSNFESIDREVCSECHTPSQAGNDCQTCHRYHVGTFQSTLPASSMQTAAEQKAQRMKKQASEVPDASEDIESEAGSAAEESEPEPVESEEAE